MSARAQALLLLTSLSFTLSTWRAEATPQEPQSQAPPPPELSAFSEGEALKGPAELWAEPGFRLSLHGLYGAYVSLDEHLNAALRGVEVSAGARLKRSWSLLGRLQYALATEGVEGLHFNASLEPSFHLLSWLSVGASLGLAGVIEFEEVRPDQQAELNGQLVAPYDHLKSDPTLPRCEGFGPSEALRLNLRYLLGQLSALTAGLYVSRQRVTCLYSTERVEPDSATPIERRQSWEHLSWGLTAGVTWR